MIVAASPKLGTAVILPRQGFIALRASWFTAPGRCWFRMVSRWANGT